MRPGWRSFLVGIVAGALGATAAAGQTGTGPVAGSSLNQLLDRFEEPEGSVRLDAWVEGRKGKREVVVVLEPEGRTKLVADPGITVSAAPQPGVEWRVALPHRLVDPAREYFAPPAAVRLPFSAENGQPIRIVVEYAYCVVDFQCFFGEEALTVANVAE